MDALQIAQKLLNSIKGIVGTALPIVFALAILAFFWGITKYVFSKSGEGKVEGKGVMLWSLIAIAIMTSLYGIIFLAQKTIGVDPGSVGNQNTFEPVGVQGVTPSSPVCSGDKCREGGNPPRDNLPPPGALR